MRKADRAGYSSFVMMMSLIVAVVFCSVFLVGWVSFGTSARSLEAQAREATMLRDANLLSRIDVSVLRFQAIAQALGGNKPVLDQLTQSTSDTVSDILRLRQIMQAVSSLQMGNPQATLIGVYFHRSSTVITDGGRYTSAAFFERYQQADRSAVIQGLAAAKPFTRHVKKGDAGDVLVFGKSLPYYSAYPFGGVLVEVPVRHLEDMLTPERGAAQFILDGKSEILVGAGSDVEARAADVSALLSDFGLQPGDSRWMETTLFGELYFVAVSAGENMQVLTMIPQRGIYAGIYSIRLVTLLAGLLTALAMILIAGLILRRLYNPIRELLAVMAVRGASYHPVRRRETDLSHIRGVVDLAWRENERMQGFVAGMEDVIRQDVLIKLLDDIAVDKDMLDKLGLSGATGHFRVVLLDKLSAGRAFAECMSACERIVDTHPDAVDTIVLAQEHDRVAMLLCAQGSRPLADWEPMLRALAGALGDAALLVISAEVVGVYALHEAKVCARRALHRALMIERSGVVPADDMLRMRPNEVLRRMGGAPLNSPDALRGLYAGAIEQGDYPLAYLANVLLTQASPDDRIQSALIGLRGDAAPESALDSLVGLQPVGASARLPGRRITAYLKKNYHDPNLSLAMLADVFGYTSNYISTLLKDEMGMGFLEYLTKLRLDAAERLVLDGDKRLADIAQEVGFGHVNTFTRAFRKRHQMTAAQYRAQCGKAPELPQ